MNADVLARAEAPVPVTLPSILIDMTRPTTPVASELYGLLFEDINYAGEGGLYAELIANRFFEERLVPATWRSGPDTRHSGGGSFGSSSPVPGWQAVAPEGAQVTLELDRDELMNSSRLTSLRVTVTPGPAGRAGLATLGRDGIALRAGAAYRLRLCMRAMADFQGDLRVTLEAPDGRSLAETTLTCLSTCWSDVSCKLVSSADEPQARLSITTASGGFWLGMVSLFPVETWRGRPNGLRPDLAEMLLALRPRFLRFPGGSFGAGADAALRWKRTIGDITKRSAQRNMRGNHSTGGLGFHEFLQLAEDLNATPLFVVNYAPAWQTDANAPPPESLDEWVQDTLDAIEYANGPAENGWAMLRAQHGHPEPFGMRYIEIGDQGWGAQYDACYGVFSRAIKARYPEMVVIAAARVANGAT